MDAPIQFGSSEIVRPPSIANPQRWVMDSVARVGLYVDQASFPDWETFCTAAAKLLAYHGVQPLTEAKLTRSTLTEYCRDACRREVTVSSLCAATGLFAQYVTSKHVPTAFRIRRTASVLYAEYGVAADLAVFTAAVWCILVSCFYDLPQSDQSASLGDIQKTLASFSPVEHSQLESDIAVCTKKAGQTDAINLGSGVSIDFVWCPPGAFFMGSPRGETGHEDYETRHKVTLTKGFWMGKYAVTQRHWLAVLKNNPSLFTRSGLDAPVENVTWTDCQTFVLRLNSVIPTHSFRLPTEAEWEYACRAGTTTAFNNGKNLTNMTGRCPHLDELAWYHLWYGKKMTHPVGQKQPNAWGLYDMHGNVWEWCQDWFDVYPECEATDPMGPKSGAYRVCRGGGWGDLARYCRSALRGYNNMGTRNSYLGFRLVMDS